VRDHDRRVQVNDDRPAAGAGGGRPGDLAIKITADKKGDQPEGCSTSASTGPVPPQLS
jgi:hypothetical protein